MARDNKILLPIKRWKQFHNECAIATVASIANYYDKSITYSSVRKLVSKSKRHAGLWTPEQCILLNKLGIKNITLITCDLQIFDFSWNKLTDAGLLNRLYKVKRWYSKSPYTKSIENAVSAYIRWLQMEGCNNKIVIDNNLPKYIKRSLNKERPVGASYVSTSLWKTSKGGMPYECDIRGEILEHAVVIRGYDDEGIFVVDSEDDDGGYYKLTWNEFLANAGTGDLIIPGKK